MAKSYLYLTNNGECFMNNKVEGIIFDFDGTLVDSLYIWKTIADDYLSSLGIDPECNLYDAVSKMTIGQAAEYLKEKYKMDKSVSKIVNNVKVFAANEYCHKVPLKGGVLKAIREMSEQGIKMCVASTNDADLVRATSIRCGIDQFFSGYFSGTALNIPKTTPKLYEIALEHLGTDKNKTWIFEDSLYAVESAKSGGFKVAAVYDSSSEHEVEQLKQVADLYIESISEWKKIYD